MLTSPQCEREVPEYRPGGWLHGDGRERTVKIRFPEGKVVQPRPVQLIHEILESRLVRYGEKDENLAGCVPVLGQIREDYSETERRVRGLNGLLRRGQILPDDEVELAYLRFHGRILPQSG